MLKSRIKEIDISNGTFIFDDSCTECPSNLYNPNVLNLDLKIMD